MMIPVFHITALKPASHLCPTTPQLSRSITAPHVVLPKTRGMSRHACAIAPLPRARGGAGGEALWLPSPRWERGWG